MLTRTYTMRFVTPAFLGNAEQDGQWRTPPIKALLRQWWRVAYAGDQCHPSKIDAMRAAECRLFGVAADGEVPSCRSQVRLRLDQWSPGQLKRWDGLEQAPVRHPETERTGCKVGPMAYLGYGPLDGRGHTRMSDKVNAAINAKEAARLSVAFPASLEAGHLDQALWLMHHYGTLGGRSRNGWGSFTLTPADATTPAWNARLDDRLTRPWHDALALDWPHAIGRDEKGPLLWRTAAWSDWKPVMRRLAEIKIELRTQKAFQFASGRVLGPELRHWLSYPVTNHGVESWRKPGQGDFRLPNSLRFKLRAQADGQWHGVVFHVPCQPPPQFRPQRKTLETVWQQVHRFLDRPEQALHRIAA